MSVSSHSNWGGGVTGLVPRLISPDSPALAVQRVVLPAFGTGIIDKS